MDETCGPENASARFFHEHFPTHHEHFPKVEESIPNVNLALEEEKRRSRPGNPPITPVKLR